MLKTTAYIQFIKPGLLTSVQDQGRFGYADYGVPYSGAMDQFSYSQANFLLNNSDEAAVLEMTMIGPTMVFELPTRIVFTGAEAEVFHNEKLQAMGKIIDIRADDQIRIIQFKKGQWLYMGIEGGLQSPLFLESRSWYKGVSEFGHVQKNHSICYLSEEHYVEDHYSHPKITAHWYEKEEIQVYRGPDWNLLTDKIKKAITEQKFTLSKNGNRMGIQLQETIPNSIDNILTAPVYPGTVQLTPSGKLIVLMRDAQVTGGYPRILQLTDESLNIISQKRFSQRICFSLLEL